MMVVMTVSAHRLTRVLQAWVAMTIVLVMLLKAVLAPLAVAAATANAAPGTILVPFCSGGVIEYIAVDLFGADDGAAEPEAPADTVVAAMDCSVLGAFVMPGCPSATPASVPQPVTVASTGTSLGHCDAAEHVRPPLRGPPSLS